MNHLLHTQKNLCLLLLILLALPQAGTQTKAPVDLRKLDAYYQQALQDWDVPGMAIAIVQHDIFNLGWKSDYALLHPTNVRLLVGDASVLAEMRLDSNNPDFHFGELRFAKGK